jgi:nicotine blue oxidoreductase
MVVDTPGIGPEVIRRMLIAHRVGARLVVASYAGQQRNPVLLAREHWDGVASLAVGDVGARGYLRAYPALVTRVECSDIGDPRDIDTPDDWASEVAT